ncbi:MAG TPA: glycosyltransferase [Blastocatellia bacterium]|nr:glycosyltransferase [Blastocatellia bacterium]
MKARDGVSIVIPSWNGRHLLERFLPSIIGAAEQCLRKSVSAVEVIVVDDGSTDGTVEWLSGQAFIEADDSRSAPPIAAPTRDAPTRDAPAGHGAGGLPSVDIHEQGPMPQTNGAAPEPKFWFIRNANNLGFGRSCNKGFAQAHYPLVMLVNNDVELGSDCLSALLENFADAATFAAHCKTVDLRSGEECGTGKLGAFSKGFIRVHQSYIPRAPLAESKAGPLYSMFATGGSAMFDRAKFLELGGFDELLAPFYWEDVEVSYRAWKRGYRIVYEPRAIARHQISSTIGRLNAGQVRRVQQRNRLLFHWINLHDRRMLASHLLWVFLLALSAPFRLQPGFCVALGHALRSLPSVRPRRRQEKLASKLSDRQIFEIFRNLAEREDVIAYDHLSELTGHTARGVSA